MYARVRTDNMQGTTIAKDLVSLVFATDIENGNILQIGDYVNGREIRQGTIPAAGAKLAELALVASEEEDKTLEYNTLGEFINKQGDHIRGYRLTPKDIFSVTAEATTGDTPALGKIASVATSTKITLGDTASGVEIGRVIAVEGDWIVIEVVG